MLCQRVAYLQRDVTQWRWKVGFFQQFDSNDAAATHHLHRCLQKWWQKGVFAANTSALLHDQRHGLHFIYVFIKPRIYKLNGPANSLKDRPYRNQGSTRHPVPVDMAGRALGGEKLSHRHANLSKK